MIFTFEIDRIGNAKMEPKDKSLKAEIKKHFKGFDMQSDGTAYIQRDVRTQLHTLGVSAEQIEQLENGWPVDVDLDPWIALHTYGWDAHTIAENGMEAAEI